MASERSLTSAQDTRALGEALAAQLRAGDLVLLTGPLGAGKTTLAQGIGAGLNVRGPITSPTFVISRVHPPLDPDRQPCPLVHVDAYRLGGLDDLETLDLDTSLEESITLVEWGHGLVEHLAESYLEVELDRGADDETRRAVVRAHGPRWVGLVL